MEELSRVQSGGAYPVNIYEIKGLDFLVSWNFGWADFENPREIRAWEDGLSCVERSTELRD